MAAKVSVQGDRVKVRLPIMAPLLAFRGSFTVPLAHISDAAVRNPKQLDWGHKVMGLSSILSPVIAGTRRSGGQFSFWYAMTNRDVLVLELQDERYGKVVVSVDDPAGTVARIKEAQQSQPK